MSTWNARFFDFGHVMEGALDAVAQRREGDLLGFDRDRAGLDLRQVENVVDQRQQVGAGRVDVPGELDLLGRQVAAGVLGQLLAEDQNRVERRAQLVRHVREELRLVLRGERQLGGLFLERAAGLLDFLVLPLDFDVLLGELLRLRGELLVGLLQLGLPRLQLDRQLLRLLQQVLGPHRRLDRVEHDADRLRELLEKGQMGGRERLQRGQLDHRLGLALATVCPSSTLRCMITPFTGERISRIGQVYLDLAENCLHLRDFGCVNLKLRLRDSGRRASCIIAGIGYRTRRLESHLTGKVNSASAILASCMT